MAGEAQVGRGALVIVAAVVLGVLLLNAGTSGGDGGATATPTTTTTPGTETSIVTTSSSTTPLPPQSQTVVQVVNADTGVGGAAGRLSDQIAALGYTVVAPTNTVDLALPDTVIQFQAGFQAQAERLAAELGFGLPEIVQPMPADVAATVQTFGEPDLLVLLGVNQAR